MNCVRLETSTRKTAEALVSVSSFIIVIIIIIAVAHQVRVRVFAVFCPFFLFLE